MILWYVHEKEEDRSVNPTLTGGVDELKSTQQNYPFMKWIPVNLQTLTDCACFILLYTYFLVWEAVGFALGLSGGWLRAGSGGWLRAGSGGWLRAWSGGWLSGSRATRRWQRRGSARRFCGRRERIYTATGGRHRLSALRKRVVQVTVSSRVTAVSCGSALPREVT